MSTDLEHRLAESMHAYAANISTAGVSALARRARVRHWRRLAGRGALTATTVAGVSAALVIGLGSGPRVTPGALHAQTAAYVLSQTEGALARAGGLVEYVRATGAGADFEPTYLGLPPGQRVATTITWARDTELRQLDYARDGTLLAGQESYENPRGAALTAVLYSARAWWRVTAPGIPVRPSAPLPAVCLIPTYGAPFGILTVSRDWAALIKEDLHCGAFTIAARQVVDGVRAIKLASGPRIMQVTIGGPSRTLAETLWVNAATYMPVRILITTVTGPPTWQQADLRWLAPSRATSANFTIRVPAGFRRVSPPQTIPIG